MGEIVPFNFSKADLRAVELKLTDFQMLELSKVDLVLALELRSGSIGDEFQ